MLSQAPRTADIRNFLIVLLSAVVVACGVVGSMAYYYSPSGRFWSHHVLLEPDVIESGAYSDYDPSSGQTKRFVFERMEFSYYDQVKAKWILVNVDNDSYQKLWRLVDGDWSLTKVPRDVVALFSQARPARLSIWVQHDPNVAPLKVFQQVDFAPNSPYYRVELKNAEGPSGQWAYFEHAKVYQKVLDLFMSHP